MSGKSLGMLCYFLKFSYNPPLLENYLVLQHKQQTLFGEAGLASNLLVMNHKISVSYFKWRAVNHLLLPLIEGMVFLLQIFAQIWFHAFNESYSTVCQ